MKCIFIQWLSICPKYCMNKLRIPLTVIFSVAMLSVSGQRLGLDIPEMEAVVLAWNQANASRDSRAFDSLFADKLLFYTESVSRKRAIALKQKFFTSKPEFTQRLATEVTYIPYTSGVVLCEFTKEVYTAGSWKKYPSYLLLALENNKYIIVGESDIRTDRVLKYNLKIGEPLRIKESETANIQAADSLVIDTPALTTQGNASDLDTSVIEDRNSRSTSEARVNNADTITVPKKYAFILVGLLAGGGLMIAIADLLLRKKQRQAEIAVSAQHEHEDVARLQGEFTEFVLTLFDPRHFTKLPAQRRNSVLAGDVQSDEWEPDLQFNFNHKDEHVHFAVACIYLHRYDNGKTFLSKDSLTSQRKFEAENETQLYYIVGVGGSPDDPKEVYLIPLSKIASEELTLARLEPFQKSGMFFYNTALNRLV